LVRREAVAEIEIDGGAAGQITALGKDLLLDELEQQSLQQGGSFLDIHRVILARIPLDLNTLWPFISRLVGFIRKSNS